MLREWIDSLYDRCPTPLLPLLMLATFAACLAAPGVLVLSIYLLVRLV